MLIIEFTSKCLSNLFHTFAPNPLSRPFHIIKRRKRGRELRIKQAFSLKKKRTTHWTCSWGLPLRMLRNRHPVKGGRVHSFTWCNQVWASNQEINDVINVSVGTPAQLELGQEILQKGNPLQEKKSKEKNLQKYNSSLVPFFVIDNGAVPF